tara:strand:- start:472 stop:729 length:258 start_codon:yes stop_codon:yes gene_type:complete
MGKFSKEFCNKSPFNKAFEVHKMYKTKTANTKADHERLKKEGYDHSPYDKRGLWDNIHAKRKRGEAPNKPGDKGYPTDKAIRDSQ